MATKATSTKGVKLKRGGGETPTETFTAVAEITNVSGPNETVEQTEATSFDSTAKEYIAGLRDGGEVSFGFNFVGDDTSQVGLRTDFTNGTVRNFLIELADTTATLIKPTTIAFAAIVTQLGFDMATNAVVKGSCTLKVSGAVAVTARSAS